MQTTGVVEHGVRHVVVTRNGKVCGVVSECNLFALQRLSLAAVGDSIAHAESLDTLVLAGVWQRGPARADHQHRSGQWHHFRR